MPWNPVQSRGGNIHGVSPAAVAWSPGRLDVFALAMPGGLAGSGTNTLAHWWYPGGTSYGWGGPENLGPGWPASLAPNTSPVAVSRAPGVLDVFAIGEGRRLYHWYYPRPGTSEWGGPEELAGNTAGWLGRPHAVSWGAGRLDVFAVGEDRRILHWWFDGGWGGPEPLAGTVWSAPTAVAWGPNRLDVFAAGDDRTLWHWWYEGHGWQGPEPRGGSFPVPPAAGRPSPAPAAVSWGAGRLDVFAVGTDQRLHHWWYQNGWGGPEMLAGLAGSAPAAVSWAPGRLDVFSEYTDYFTGVVHGNHWWYPNQAGGWCELPEPVATFFDTPAATTWGAGRLDLLGAGPSPIAGDGSQVLLHTWYGPAAAIPAAPTNLQASAVSDSATHLTWQDNASNEAGFEVWEGGTLVARLPQGRTGFDHANLGAGSTHCYRVRAYGGDGVSPFSNEACATTPAPTPASSARGSFCFYLNGDWSTYITADPGGVMVYVAPPGQDAAQVQPTVMSPGASGWSACVPASAGGAGVWSFRCRVRGRYADGSAAEVVSPVWRYDWEARSPAAYITLDTGGARMGYGDWAANVLNG
ncbi:hypothetical protein [Longimicrobium sp.]|uniref:hypothetical protein n=1 Tax=Longimicrobium sp. TaxID=2029185 RepID=UPI002CCCF76C|nr:hypothetical protein [Longimicrobium sp.]HSU15043.1 hypothetical protein [Longimicrobium sp.]